MLTGGRDSAFNIVTAHLIDNNILAVADPFQVAKDHGILDDSSLRGLGRQLDTVEHTSGVFACLGKLGLSDECSSGVRIIIAVEVIAVAACAGAVFILVYILLDGAALNDGVLHTIRAICLFAGDGLICKCDLRHGKGLLIRVYRIRRKLHLVSVRVGVGERRACPSVLYLGVVLPAQTLRDCDCHSLSGHRQSGQSGQIVQTLFDYAKGFGRACIGGLVYQNIFAIVDADYAKHLAVRRVVSVVDADRFLVHARHIGGHCKLFAYCANKRYRIGGTRQSTIGHHRLIAVPNNKLADLLSCGKQLLDAVKQFAQNLIRAGVGVIALRIEITALDIRIGVIARAIAVKGFNGSSGVLDRTVPIDRVDARAEVVDGSFDDLTASDIHSAVSAKLSADNMGIGVLEVFVDGHIARQVKVEVLAALFQDLQIAFIDAVVGVFVLIPAVPHVNTVQLCVLVLTGLIGHVG